MTLQRLTAIADRHSAEVFVKKLTCEVDRVQARLHRARGEAEPIADRKTSICFTLIRRVLIVATVR